MQLIHYAKEKIPDISFTSDIIAVSYTHLDVYKRQRGSIQIIGATTETEYRKYIEPDAALARRFQPVTVHEPDKSTADNILFGLRPVLEKYHHVRIMDEAVKKAVEPSIRYLPERRLPDKAIDLLDEACSRASILSDQKDSTDDMLTAFIQRGDFAEAAALYAKTASENSAPVISGTNISVILEKKTGIPVSDQCAPIRTVSYTHLDVYKRQILCCSSALRRAEISGSFGRSVR